MKTIHAAIITLLLSPASAFALTMEGGMGGGSPHVIEVDAEYGADSVEYESPMLAAALNDPHANAADLGLAPPSSSWSLSRPRSDPRE